MWPERFTVEDLEATRRALGSYLWSALYLGRPAPLDGNVFRRSWFRYYEHSGDTYKLHDSEPRTVNVNSCRRFVTVDLAVSQRKSADYTVVAVWGVTKQHDLLLLHRVRKRLPAPGQVPMLRKLHDDWTPDTIGIEAVAFQLAIVQQARQDGLPVKELRPDKDKVSRALTAAARLEAGTVYWPRNAPWLDEWESELLLFPNSRHDDQTDTFSYAALQVAELQATTIVDLSGWTDALGQVSPNRP